jgi:hypothetical protein
MSYSNSLVQASDLSSGELHVRYWHKADIPAYAVRCPLGVKRTLGAGVINVRL